MYFLPQTSKPGDGPGIFRGFAEVATQNCCVPVVFVSCPEAVGIVTTRVLGEWSSGSDEGVVGFERCVDCETAVKH